MEPLLETGWSEKLSAVSTALRVEALNWLKSGTSTKAALAASMAWWRSA